MPQTTNNWREKIVRFFEKHPEREFYVGMAGPTDLKEAAQAFWLIGVATHPIATGFAELDCRPDQPAVPVVIRRPDPAGGQPNPGVIVLDGGITLPPFPKPVKLRARAMDSFGNFIWTTGGATARAGTSIKEALADMGLIRRLS